MAHEPWQPMIMSERSKTDRTGAASPEAGPTNWTEPRKPKRWPLMVGGIITIAWVGFLTIYVIVMRSHFYDLTANEFGDFLAGSFAPLAFLWLVLGFWQQGQELRHSADALRLQGQELHHSVEQQRQLVQVTREQLAFERELIKHERDDLARRSQPIFAITPQGSVSSSPGKRAYRFGMVNHGRPCTDVLIDISGYPPTLRKAALGTGEVFDFSLDQPIEGVSQHFADIHFRDERLKPGMKQFRLDRDGGSWMITLGIDSYDVN